MLHVLPLSSDQLWAITFLTGTAENLQLTVGVAENAGLNRAEIFAIVNRPDDVPGPAVVFTGFKMHAPFVVLAAGGTENSAVCELHWLVFLLDRED